MKKKMVNREKRIWEKRKKKKEKERKRNERVWERVVGANCNMFKSTSVQLSTVPLPLSLSSSLDEVFALPPSLALLSLSLSPSFLLSIPYADPKQKKCSAVGYSSVPLLPHNIDRRNVFCHFFSSSVFLCLNVCLCVTWYCDNRFQNLCWKISDRNFRFLVIILKF